MPVRRPSDGQVHGAIPIGDAALVDQAVSVATAAAAEWRKVAPRARARLLRRWADLIDRDVDLLARMEAVVSSRFHHEAMVVDVPNASEWLRFYGEYCDKIDGAVLPTADNALAMVVNQPYGVVGAIAPWNFPLILSMWKVAPAIAAGNAVVLKPSELTPFSIVHVARLAIEAGLPAGLFNVVQGDGPGVGSAIVTHPGIGYVSFTGSTATGRRLMADAAMSGPKPVGLELGGKGVQLVFDDAGDLDTLTQKIIWGISRNAGQLCYAGSRLVVQRGIADALVERVVAGLEALRPGQTWDKAASLPPILSDMQGKKIDGIVRDTVDAGASLLTGGGFAEVEGARDGIWYRPTVLADVPAGARGVAEEIFGPVLTVQRFDAEEEGIALSNHASYGLSASVHSRDISRAIRSARAMEAGTIWVNGWGRQPDFSAPFGGWKQSGFGKEAGRDGYQKYLRQKTIWAEL
ncbi:aldehyde dehydrogenase [Sphingomonas crocodyli]|uniref:Aldehyde dehydrogenase n=2 Tax=Sphingomonas crocodyli TaxID=1979270 RepID=A0A437M1B6_9SPHN|nr:aldehyde dehydrogenase [Sphingomonas crocodyli]